MRHYTMLHLAYRWLGHDSSASKQPRKNRECISPLPPFPLSEYHSFYGWSELKLHSFFYQKHWWILTLPSASNGRWLVHLGVWHVWSRDWTGYNTISRLWILLVAYLLQWIFKNWCIDEKELEEKFKIVVKRSFSSEPDTGPWISTRPDAGKLWWVRLVVSYHYWKSIACDPYVLAFLY